MTKTFSGVPIGPFKHQIAIGATGFVWKNISATLGASRTVSVAVAVSL